MRIIQDTDMLTLPFLLGFHPKITDGYLLMTDFGNFLTYIPYQSFYNENVLLHYNSKENPDFQKILSQITPKNLVYLIFCDKK